MYVPKSSDRKKGAAVISFTDYETEQIKKRALENPEFIENIIKRSEDVRNKLYIQKKGIGTWTHYYVCPKHAVQLKLNYYDRTHHICPIDGEVYTGEPYDGAWQSFIDFRNHRACYELAVAYMAAGNKECLEVVHDILLGYAKYYPSYEIHGDIPYNKPGKVGSQVLNDACFLNDVARAYDIVKDTFTSKEQEFIETNLLLEGALFLKEHGTPQIHNHEVAACSSIGIIGIILGRQDLIEHAVNEKYGLKYQLDNAVLADGIWFEIAMGYHYYALLWFFRYEKFVRHTQYSLLKDEHYRDILYSLLTYGNKITDENGGFYGMNDNPGSFKGHIEMFEYGYSYFKDDKTLFGLYYAMNGKPRTTVDALLYGTFPLPDKPKHEYKNYYSKSGSNLAIVRGSGNRLLFFKAAPYGGEHDHYDRMALNFSAYGSDVCADLGTASGYGSPLHYGYFKNTATHNTVCINGDNMPPAETEVIEYIENSYDDIYLDARTVWSSDFNMPDSFTIKQWCNESYDGVKMRRIVQWYDKFFVDVFMVDSPNTLQKDWTWHIRGELQAMDKNVRAIESVGDKAPQRIIHSAYELICKDDILKSSYNCDGFILDIYSRADNCKTIYAKGPDNPSIEDIAYLIERCESEKAVFVNIFEAHKENDSLINSVKICTDDKITVEIKCKDGSVKVFSPKF